MKKKTVFYIWEYGASPESEQVKIIKKALNTKKYNVCSDYYAQYNPDEALLDLKNILSEVKPDLIIGSGLAGYLALQLKDHKKIIIDPYLKPDVELEKITEEVIDKDGQKETIKSVPQHIIDYYKEYVNKHNVWENFDDNEKELTSFVLSNTYNDRDEIMEHSSNVNVIIGQCDTKECLKDLIVPLIKYTLNE